MGSVGADDCATSAGAGAGAGAAGFGAALGAGAGAGAGAGRFEATGDAVGLGAGGAEPVTTVLVAISVEGSSTIFSAEMTIPFLSSYTEAFFPSTMKR